VAKHYGVCWTSIEGASFDKALTATINDLYKADLVRRCQPGRLLRRLKWPR
jgi:hypothetical protein